MNRAEYWLAALLLRLVRWIVRSRPVDPRKVVLATARVPRLEGNLAFVDAAIRERDPGLQIVHLLEPYSYGLAGKFRYLVRLARGMVHLQTARLFIVDNAYLPIHVAPHRPGTTVVQVWHAVGALKRFGVDTAKPPREPERTFLHRHYDYVIAAGEAARAPYGAALRTPVERVLALGAPRTDFFFDEAAMAGARARLLAAHPSLAGRTVVLYAPTFRGRGRSRRAAPALDAARLRARLPIHHLLALKGHPNLDPTITPTGGYDLVFDPAIEINELFTVADVLVTDYSSSIYEWALLRRPLVLLTADLEEYERDPGLYLDYRAQMIGTQVRDADGVADAISQGRFDLSGYDAFVARNLERSDGRASLRFAARFLPAPDGR
jgi:CDP-ribitol ribitolphosphotransferase